MSCDKNVAGQNKTTRQTAKQPVGEENQRENDSDDNDADNDDWQLRLCNHSKQTRTTLTTRSMIFDTCT